MLLVPDKKKMATLIISRSKPDYVQGINEKSDFGPLDMDSAEGDDEAPKVMAARAVLKAMESKSAKSLAEALYQFFELCEESESEEEGSVDSQMEY